MRAPDPHSVVHRTLLPVASAPLCVQAASAWRGAVRPRRPSLWPRALPALVLAAVGSVGLFAWSAARPPAPEAARIVVLAR